jgi:uncharacterized membrane protein YhhN
MNFLTFGRLRHFGVLERWLLFLSIGSSAAYLVTRGIQPFPGSVVLKGLAMAPLAVLAVRVLGEVDRARGATARDSHLLGAALALSCLGDVLLHLGFRSYFGLALAAFLFAHIAYILLFARSWTRPLRPSRRELTLAALILAYSVVVTGWLTSNLGAYAVPLIVYSAAITAMTMSAVLARFSTPLVVIGAMLFLLSDSLIAAWRFKATLPLGAYLIWPTYYVGQYAIAIGVLRESAGDGDPSPPDA